MTFASERKENFLSRNKKAKSTNNSQSIQNPSAWHVISEKGKTTGNINILFYIVESLLTASFYKKRCVHIKCVQGMAGRQAGMSENPLFLPKKYRTQHTYTHTDKKDKQQQHISFHFFFCPKCSVPYKILNNPLLLY